MHSHSKNIRLFCHFDIMKLKLTEKQSKLNKDTCSYRKRMLTADRLQQYTHKHKLERVGEYFFSWKMYEKREKERKLDILCNGASSYNI